jgi:hypothetical protein
MFEVLSSAQMNGVDINGSRAIDGYAGGTYNPSAIITINQEFFVDATGAVGANATGITATGKGNEPGISATGGATAGVGVVGNGGVNGVGGYFTGNGSGSGVIGRGGATGNGVEGVGFGTAFGGTFTGGNGAPLAAGFSCAGVYSEGGSHAPFAVTGDGNCCGLVGVGGNSNTAILTACAGVYGYGGNDGGCGVVGIAHGDGGTTNFYGVLGKPGVLNGGGGVKGDGDSTGIGVWAGGGSVLGAALHIDPQLAAPSAGVLTDGDVWIEGGILHVRMSGTTYAVDVTAAP